MRLDGKEALDALRTAAIAKVKPTTAMISVGTTMPPEPMIAPSAPSDS
jgi:hypothetical protein